MHRRAREVNVGSEEIHRQQREEREEEIGGQDSKQGRESTAKNAKGRMEKRIESRKRIHRQERQERGEEIGGEVADEALGGCAAAHVFTDCAA